MIARVVLYCLVGGLPLTIAGLGAGHVGWWWLSGIVLAAAFVPVARYGPRGAWRQFAAIAPAVFVVGVFCIWTEMLLFMPQLRPQAVNILVGNTITYLIVAGILAVLARILGLTRASVLVASRSAACLRASRADSSAPASALWWPKYWRQRARWTTSPAVNRASASQPGRSRVRATSGSRV